MNHVPPLIQSRRSLSTLLSASPNTLRRDEEMLKILIRDFREEFRSEFYSPYICWVLTCVRYESRANQWQRRHGRKILKQWIRSNKNNLSKQAFNRYQTTQKLNQQ